MGFLNEIQMIKNFPWYGKVMFILTILILVMTTVSRCCKYIAEALEKVIQANMKTLQSMQIYFNWYNRVFETTYLP